MSQIPVDLPPDLVERGAAEPDLASRFHRACEELYAVDAPDDRVEFVSWEVHAFGVAAATAPAAAVRPLGKSEADARRQTFCGPSGSPAAFDLFMTARLGAGDCIEKVLLSHRTG